MPTPTNPNRRLLVLCQLFYPEMVSTGQTLTELCIELSKLGWNIEVICAAPTMLATDPKTPKIIDFQNIRINRVWATQFPKLNLLGRILNQVTFTISTFFYLLFQSRDRTILVLTNPPFLPFACVAAKALRKSLKFALLVFDVYPDTAIHLGVIKSNGLTAKTWDWLNIKSFNMASRIIVIGRCMKDVIIQKGANKSIKLDTKTEMIHIWADDEAIASASKEIPPVYKKHRLEGKFIALYSGNMGRFHDLETILEAAKELKNHPRIRFAFIGEGAKKHLVETFVLNNGLQNCAVDTYVPKEDLGSLLRHASVGLASLAPGQEGLSVPSKTLGLMAAGVPIIAIMNQNSEIAQLTIEATLGKVIRPGDSNQLVKDLLAMEADPAQCNIYGKNGLKLVNEHLSLKKAAKDYSDLIEDIQCASA